MLSRTRPSFRQFRCHVPHVCVSVQRSFSAAAVRMSTKRTMEETFQDACATKAIPGAVLVAADKSGKFDYSRAIGVRSLHPSGTGEPLTVDSIMATRSCTKLLTSIAAMQCVERQLVTLDEDVRPILPELGDIDILTAAEDGKLYSEKNKLPITLRQLLTHTSGLSYEFNEPLLQQWRKEQPEEPHPYTVRDRYQHPLLYEPASDWSYGPSIDWAGVLVERVTNSKSLQDYMAHNIWEPLGIVDMTFFLSKRRDLHDRIVSMSFREEAQSSAVYAAESLQYTSQPDMDDAQGGGGVFTSAVEYLKVMRALLVATDPSASDAKVAPPKQLLRRSTANDMFQPQLNQPAIAKLQATSEYPQFNRMLGGMPTQTRKDWGLGGMLVMDDLPGWRSKSTMTWGGMPNLTWWIDREVGLCGLYASQLLPVGDETSVEMMQLFEKTMYERHASAVKTESA